MKPHLHPSSFLILFFTFLISTNTLTSICQQPDDERYLNCSNAFMCGNTNITNLRYPFYGGNRPKYCGDPGLEELTCEEDVPKISIDDIKYRINAWDNTTQQLTLARDDYLGPKNVCVSQNDYKNSTFDNTPFVYDRGMVANVSLFYDCTQTPTFPNDTATVLASNCDTGRNVYYHVGDPVPFSSSCTIVLLPIFGSNSSLVASGRIYEALSNGFELIWTRNYEECTTCLDSGGQCGSDGEFQCLCRDGSHSTSCSVTLTGSSSAFFWIKIALGASSAVLGATTVLIVAICYDKRNRQRLGQK